VSKELEEVSSCNREEAQKQQHRQHMHGYYNKNCGQMVEAHRA
jgi:hypothetical protein